MYTRRTQTWIHTCKTCCDSPMKEWTCLRIDRNMLCASQGATICKSSGWKEMLLYHGSYETVFKHTHIHVVVGIKTKHNNTLYIFKTGGFRGFTAFCRSHCCSFCGIWDYDVVFLGRTREGRRELVHEEPATTLHPIHACFFTCGHKGRLNNRIHRNCARVLLLCSPMIFLLHSHTLRIVIL